MPDEIVLAALDYQQVIRQEVYLKATEDGVAEIITREQCEKELAAIKSAEVATAFKGKMPLYDSSLNSVKANKENSYYFDNGYMVITTAASRIAKHSGNDETWLVSGQAEWLKIPYFRWTDMITIASSALYDSDYSYYEYGYKTCYRRCGTHGVEVYSPHKYDGWYASAITKEYEDSNFGVSYKADFDPDICSLTNEKVTGILAVHEINEERNHTYYGQYAVNTGVLNDNFNVLVGYGHNHFTLTGVSASVSTSGAAGVGISFSTGTEEYISRPLLVKPYEYK